MKRKIIHIQEALCNGCGLCAAACHEGAIGMINGKARLLREDYCDGLGDCLPACPTGAISFEEREAMPYDHSAVQAAKQAAQPCGCPGARAAVITKPSSVPTGGSVPSHLSQWPVQLRLAPVKAPYFSGAQLLIAADCTAYAFGDFHARFLQGKIALIGCPKLDEDPTEKLAAILTQNDIAGVTVVRMEVPCCQGLERAVRQGLGASGKHLPLRTAVLSTDGRILKGPLASHS